MGHGKSCWLPTQAQHTQTETYTHTQTHSHTRDPLVTLMPFAVRAVLLLSLNRNTSHVACPSQCARHMLPCLLVAAAGMLDAGPQDASTSLTWLRSRPSTARLDPDMIKNCTLGLSLGPATQSCTLLAMINCNAKAVAVAVAGGTGGRGVADKSKASSSGVSGVNCTSFINAF